MRTVENDSKVKRYSAIPRTVLKLTRLCELDRVPLAQKAFRGNSETHPHKKDSSREGNFCLHIWDGLEGLRISIERHHKAPSDECDFRALVLAFLY